MLAVVLAKDPIDLSRGQVQLGVLLLNGGRPLAADLALDRLIQDDVVGHLIPVGGASAQRAQLRRGAFPAHHAHAIEFAHVLHSMADTDGDVLPGVEIEVRSPALAPFDLAHDGAGRDLRKAFGRVGLAILDRLAGEAEQDRAVAGHQDRVFAAGAEADEGDLGGRSGGQLLGDYLLDLGAVRGAGPLLGGGVEAVEVDPSVLLLDPQGVQVLGDAFELIGVESHGSHTS